MKRPGRLGIAGLAAAALLALGACVTPGIYLPPAPPATGRPIAVQTTPVPMDLADPAHQAIGDFRYAGGFVLSSSDTDQLHGLSDIVLSAGDRITSVTDNGWLMTGRLLLDGDGRLTGLTDVTLRQLADEQGRKLETEEERDAEGLTILANGDLLISFEQQHRIRRFAPTGDRPIGAAPMPAEAMYYNDGMEGLTVAPTLGPDAYWVGVEPGEIWLCRLKAACQEVKGLPQPPTGFRLSSLAVGPRGELVILHHVYVGGLNASRIEVTVVRDPLGARTVIGHFAMSTPLSVDNFEGIVVEPRADGSWRLYLQVDDNFRKSQRTLVMAFDWTPPT